jgi:uncharacterized membrane protein (DUF106 family)
MVQKHYEFGVFAKTVTAIAAIFLLLLVAAVDVGIFCSMLGGFLVIALATYVQKVDDQKKRIKELEEMLEEQQQEENPDQSQ